MCIQGIQHRKGINHKEEMGNLRYLVCILAIHSVRFGARFISYNDSRFVFRLTKNLDIT